MTLRVRLTPRGVADIKAIARYTTQTWGHSQCQSYLRSLDDRFRWLAEHPASGRPRDDVAESSRSFRHNAHIVFYRTRDDGIDVLAVVHSAMDIDGI
ncbi:MULTISPECIES: type II toxin-antitoxin system RelE/ParE family toxin [Maricaulis]|uniref:Toxin n=1 Tax=Maricaulis maris (strain MCS10) TaxID=394221 RepID=Q0AP66_MARMM|nr:MULTISPECIES: type II toxin-antitoxin system RelE/ParE family toxin [Maricaulis]ABI65921.1 plasmid stabilization system [Maricaulis maris MCS10]